MKFSHLIKPLTLMLGAAVTLGGCMVSATPAARVVTYEPQPAYYDGYVVHYDSVGPYVYVGRAPRYIPRHHPRYGELARHRPRRYRHYY